MKKITNMEKVIRSLYNLYHYELQQVEEHEGGRNIVYVCKQNAANCLINDIAFVGFF